jgi:ankyrin repeat protein
MQKFSRLFLIPFFTLGLFSCTYLLPTGALNHGYNQPRLLPSEEARLIAHLKNDISLIKVDGVPIEYIFWGGVNMALQPGPHELLVKFSSRGYQTTGTERTIHFTAEPGHVYEVYGVVIGPSRIGKMFLTMQKSFLIRWEGKIRDITDAYQQRTLNSSERSPHQGPSELEDYFAAARTGDTDTLAGFLENGVDLEHKNRDGVTSLFLASINGQTEIAKMLLDHGADPNTKMRGGPSALIRAASMGHGNIVTILLVNGAQVNGKDNKGRTSLHYIESGNTDTAMILVENGADVSIRDKVGMSPLDLAIYKGNTDVIQVFIDVGADVNGIIPLTGYLGFDIEGNTPLMTAASRQETHAAKILLDHGADVHKTNHFGLTALMLASRRGNSALVQMLLDAGADVNAKTKAGDTALSNAAGYGHGYTVEVLLDHGADVNVMHSTRLEWTVLMEAAYDGHADIVKTLLERGADVNFKNKKGQTALSLARKKEIQELLKHAGAK